MTDIESALDCDVRFLRRGKKSVFLYLPREYHAHIGLVIAYWGQFEILFEALLEGIVAAIAQKEAGFIPPNLIKIGFKSKAKLLRNLSKILFEESKPEIFNELMRILNQSISLSAQRNIIAHGTYRYTILPKSSTATNIRAFDHARNTEIPLTINTIKQIYYDISHMTADFVVLAQKFAHLEGHILLISDDEVLDIYEKTPQQNYTTKTPRS